MSSRARTLVMPGSITKCPILTQGYVAQAADPNCESKVFVAKVTSPYRTFLSSYTVAARCPVFASLLALVLGGISLCTCSAMSGTDMVFAAICQRVCCAMSGTNIAHGAISLCTCYGKSGTKVTPIPGLVTYHYLLKAQVSSYSLAMQCPVLTRHMLLQGSVRVNVRASYPMPGTDMVYTASRSTYALAMQCPAIHIKATASHDFQRDHVISAICLRACYAMSGTEIAYGATGVQHGRAGSSPPINLHCKIKYKKKPNTISVQIVPGMRWYSVAREALLLSGYALATPGSSIARASTGHRIASA
eukprot:2456889-Rhodomonas_salina.1